MKTNNMVDLSWAQAVLDGAGIASFVFDAHSSIVEGSIGAIPQRLMVSDEDEERAIQVLDSARADLLARSGDE
jgi:hypothetical protein